MQLNKLMKKSFLLTVAVCVHVLLFAQNAEVYPTHWWVGMKNPKLQLMIHGANVANGSSDISIRYAGVTVEKVHKVENKNYDCC